MPSTRYEFIWEHVRSGVTTKEVIKEIADEKNIDFLVIGYSGIKGPKQ